MSNDNTGFFANLWPFSGDESRKVRYLATAYALLIFAYSMFKPLKDTVFLSFVGPIYQPQAKLLMVVMLPLITMLYSFIVGHSKRYHAALFFILLYAITCIGFAALFLHPVLGVANTVTSPWRLTGWLYYGLFDVFSLTVMTTFWAVTSSVSTPQQAAAQYGIMAAGSKLAGMIASAIGHFLLKSSLPPMVAIPTLLMLCCMALIGAAYAIRQMFCTIDHKLLEGYTDQHESPKQAAQPLSTWDGFKSIIAQPYAFGIFGLICGYELIATLIDFRVQCLIAAQTAYSIKGIGSFIFGYTFCFQGIGFIIALFGTTRLPKLLGMRASLLVTPALLLCIALMAFTNASLWTLTTVMIVMRALNYGFNIPVREMLFIPTSKTIQFLAKGWIESFSKTFSKVSGSMFNYLTAIQATAYALPITMGATLGISSLWMIVAFLMGGSYQRAIDENLIIGAE